jgi:serine/threonine-protein kinase ATR
MQAYVRAAHDKGVVKGKAGLITWLEDVVRTYPPIFHRWFLATWAEPAAWLNARLNYTRSYAVWCMVGHIAGLGDRHGENVLLDMQRGDAIQIDFGCLFDKGLTLALPEVVPFRLTQNVIDGFGVAGVEGVYRRSCETTLSVLRKHYGTILSVMDTFVHDPLVEWARDEKKLRNVAATSGAAAEAENPQAKDAMATIEGRLKGTLLGVSARPCMPLSVEGHVHRLIVEATAKENLSRMYIWWGPFQ